MTKGIQRDRNDLDFVQILITEEMQLVTGYLTKEYQFDTKNDLSSMLESILSGEYPPDSPDYLNERIALLHYYSDDFRSRLRKFNETYPGESIQPSIIVKH